MPHRVAHLSSATTLFSRQARLAFADLVVSTALLYSGKVVSAQTGASPLSTCFLIRSDCWITSFPALPVFPSSIPSSSTWQQAVSLLSYPLSVSITTEKRENSCLS